MLELLHAPMCITICTNNITACTQLVLHVLATGNMHSKPSSISKRGRVTPSSLLASLTGVAMGIALTV